jgi:hypothetical protein
MSFSAKFGILMRSQLFSKVRKIKKICMAFHLIFLQGKWR